MKFSKYEQWSVIFLILGTKILDSKKSAAPAFSFGSRHQNNTRTIGPGPSAYNIVGLAAKGKDTPPQISLQSRAKATKIVETPGKELIFQLTNKLI